MPRAKRGELWMADLGFVAKVRPVLILSDDDHVPSTTAGAGHSPPLRPKKTAVGWLAFESAQRR